MAEGVDLSKTLTGGSEELFEVCCSPCLEDGTEAEKYNCICEIHYCWKCLTYHNRIPCSREHKIFDKSQAEVGITKTRLPTQRCLKHHRKLMDMHCADHDVVCCDECIAVKHRTCVKVNYLPDVARGIKERKEYIKGMIYTDKCDLHRDVTKRIAHLTSLENESENILAEINQHEEHIISKIRPLARTTKNSFNIKVTESRNTLTEDIKTITSVMTTISLHEENILNGNEEETFAKVKHGKTVVKDCKILLSDLSGRSNCKRLCFVANNKLESEVNASECIGTANILEENKEDKKIKSEEQKIDSSHSEIKEEIKEEKLTVEVGAEKKKYPQVRQYTATLSAKYKVNESPYEVTAACVLDNTSLMLFDNTNCVLKRLSMEDFKIFDKLKLQWLSYSICSVGSEEVAVAFWFIRKIQLVSVGRTMALTRSFSTDYYCRGVAFNDVSEEFYVSNNSNQVNVYDKNGTLMKYDRDGEGRFMFTAACNVAWSEDKAVLYVTDSREGLIALSMSGELLWTFTDSELKNANGICVLPGDVILVSGVNSHNVIQVDKRGKKIGTLLGAGDSLNKPYALAFDRNRSRLIVGHYSKEILAYNLTPKY